MPIGEVLGGVGVGADKPGKSTVGATGVTGADDLLFIGTSGGGSVPGAGTTALPGVVGAGGVPGSFGSVGSGSIGSVPPVAITGGGVGSVVPFASGTFGVVVGGTKSPTGGRLGAGAAVFGGSRVGCGMTPEGAGAGGVEVPPGISCGPVTAGAGGVEGAPAGGSAGASDFATGLSDCRPFVFANFGH